MIGIDVCLEMVFTDLPAEERIGRIAAAGYDCVEFWHHDSTFDGQEMNTGLPKDVTAINQACAEAGVTINNIVVNSPDWLPAGPISKRDHSKYLDRVEEVIAFARSIGCRKAITCAGNEQSDLSREEMHDNLAIALESATTIAAREDFVLLLEPLNVHVDHPGYYLHSSAEGAELVREIGDPHLRLLFDLYHMQVMEGNLIASIRKYGDLIGHFHAAGVPGRHELYGGELDYPAILAHITETGYNGYIGLEFTPALEDHTKSLRRIKQYLSTPAMQGDARLAAR